MCYSSLFKWWHQLHYRRINSQRQFEHRKFNVQLKFVQMDCTDYTSMDIFEFLDLKEICKFSNDHLKITTLNKYHAIEA